MRGKLSPASGRDFALCLGGILLGLRVVLLGPKRPPTRGPLHKSAGCEFRITNMKTRMNTDLMPFALIEREQFVDPDSNGSTWTWHWLVMILLKGAFLAWMLVCVCPGFAQSPGANETVNTAEDTLQAVRNSLIKLAMEGPTQVRSTSWIDDTGVLRDSAEFTNEMVVRGVRILAYTHDAEDHAEVSMDAKKEQFSVAKSCAAQRDSKAHLLKGAQHLVVFDVAIAPQIKFQNLYLTRMISKALKENLLSQSDESRILKMNLNALPTDSVSLSGVNANKATLQAVFPSSINAYQQALLGRGEQRVTWQASLYLEPAQDEITQAPGLKISTVLQNRLDKRQTMTFEEHVWFESMPQKSYSSVLSSVMSAQVNAVAKSLERQMESELACIPPQFEVMKWQGQQLVLAAGSMNGLKVGDQFVVVDPSILPAHALQAGAMQRMALAEVRHVSPYTAELKQVAGPALSGQAAWVAVAHDKP